MSRMVWIEDPRRPKSTDIIINFGLKFHCLINQWASRNPAKGPEIRIAGIVTATPSILKSLGRSFVPAMMFHYPIVSESFNRNADTRRQNKGEVMITAFIKLVFHLIRLAIILAVLGLIFHAWVLRQGLKAGLSWGLGAPVEIGSVKMDWKNTGFEVRDLEVGNPHHYPPGLLADIPLAIVSVDITKIPEGVLRLKAVGLSLRELVVTHIPGKGLNVMELKALKREKTSGRLDAGSGSSRKRIGSKTPRVMIDEFIVSVGTITFVESVGTIQKEKRIKAGIQGQTFYDLAGPEDMAYVVVTLALKKSGYGFSANALSGFSGEEQSSGSGSGFLNTLKSIFS